MATYDGRPSAFTQLSTTADWESFMSSAGIYDGVDSPNSFTPSLDTVGRNAVIGSGQGLIKGQLWRCDANVSTAIPAASAQNRLDRLVLRLNRGATSSPGVVAPTVITGTPSGSPALPAISQTPTGLWDIPISYWTSASSGALTGLVDQRQFTGRVPLSMTSGGWRPSPANIGMAIETDTYHPYIWNGSNWMLANRYVQNNWTQQNYVSATPVVMGSDNPLSWNVVAGVNYCIKVFAVYSSAATAGAPTIGLNGTCNMQNVNGYSAWYGGGFSFQTGGFILGTFSNMNGPVLNTGNNAFVMEAYCQCVTGGVFNVRAQTNGTNNWFLKGGMGSLEAAA